MRRALLALLALTACVPAQNVATGAINQALGDRARLQSTKRSLVFTPVGEVTRVVVDVRGRGLVALDPADNCTGTTEHLVCSLGDVSEPAVIELIGDEVSAVVSYRRAGRWFFKVLVVP